MSTSNPYSPPSSDVGGDTSELSIPDQPLNPWVSIWTRPRVTIQQIVTTDPERSVLLLAGVAGISEALSRASMRGLGDRIDVPIILVISILVGPIGGIISLYIGAAFVRWTGAWIGGVATSQHVRAAMAWSGVPMVCSLALWIPQLALFGEELFTTETPRLDENPSLLVSLVGFGLIELTLAIWAIVLFLKALGQVQGFSAWKALGNVLLALAVIVIPIAAIALAIASATRA